VVDFARPKDGKSLDHDDAKARFLTPKQITGAHREDGTVASAVSDEIPFGSWRVDIPSSSTVQVDVSEVENIQSQDQMPSAVCSRANSCSPATGEITELAALAAPPPIIHGKAPTAA
jgi:hypothetical protein